MSSVIAFLLLVAVTATTWHRLRASQNAVFLFSLALFSFGFLLRALVLVLGFDSLSPDNVFLGDDGTALTESLVALSVWLVCFFLGAKLVAARPPLTRRGIDRLDSKRRSSALARVGVILSVVTAAGAGWLLITYGGIDELTRANKIEKGFAGFFGVKALPYAGFLVNAAVGLGYLKQQRRARSLTHLGLALMCAATPFLLGIRTTVGIAILVIVVGWQVFRPGTQNTTGGMSEGGPRKLQSRVAIALAATLTIGGVALILLRESRDVRLSGRVIALDEDVVRRTSLALNLVHLDAYVLARRDIPSTYPVRGVESLIAELAAPVPRSLWAEKPNPVPYAVVFRQLYEPNARNGWPSGGPGTWYLAIGDMGTILGGLLTGLVAGHLARRFDSFEDPVEFVLGAVVGLAVVNTGVTGRSLTELILWVVPFVLISRLVVGSSPIRSRDESCPDVGALGRSLEPANVTGRGHLLADEVEGSVRR